MLHVSGDLSLEASTQDSSNLESSGAAEDWYTTPIGTLHEGSSETADKSMNSQSTVAIEESNPESETTDQRPEAPREMQTLSFEVCTKV